VVAGAVVPAHHGQGTCTTQWGSEGHPPSSPIPPPPSPTAQDTACVANAATLEALPGALEACVRGASAHQAAAAGVAAALCWLVMVLACDRWGSPPSPTPLPPPRLSLTVTVTVTPTPRLRPPARNGSTA
jgi:hypothetical protein